MKKLMICAVLMAMLVPFSSAGDIGNIIGSDMMIGIAGGGAMGCAFATPSYMGGGQKNATTFLVGAGWGALAGAVIGLGYGIYGVTDHVKMRSNSKASIDSNDIYVNINVQKFGLQFTKTF
jgi:hypothetical protein